MVLKKAESELEYNKVISLLLELQKDHSDQYPRLFRDYVDHVQFKKLSEELSTEEDNKRISECLDTFLYFEEEENIVGCAFVQDRVRKNEFAFIDSTQLFVTCFIIDKSYRNKGIGKRSFNLLKGWAKEQGYHRVELSVSHANQSAINLYESLGFEKEMMYMSCEI